MWQQIIVYLIGAAVAAYVGVAVYRLITKRSDPCAGCVGCDLKREFEIKRMKCGEKNGKNKGADVCGRD